MAVFNPYVSGFKTAVLPWEELHDTKPGITDRILAHAKIKVLAFFRKYNCEAREKWPLADRPEDLQRWNNFDLLLDMMESLVIERSRAKIMGHGPEDKLTVTFSDVVLNCATFCPFDKKCLNDAIDRNQTWTHVSKLRLVRDRSRPPSSVHSTQRLFSCNLELVRQGADGEETVRLPQILYFGRDHPQRSSWDFCARRLTEDLHLRHTVVGGADVFSI